jgi:hypothetical protein
MKQISLLFLISAFVLYSFNCQSAAKLNGTPISSNSWVGLEFSSPVKISQIGWAQNGQSKDNLLGVFEGSNDKTFSDSIPLYMIKGNEQNFLEVTCTKAFKYVRYVGPNGKRPSFSQLEVYGEESNEDSAEPEKIYQPTNLPLIVVNTENGAMPADKDKDTQIKSNIVIIKDGKVNTKGSGTIKYRGNSTLDPAKKSFRIKFDEKTNVLDLPAKAKKWVLFANMYDKTLLRNRIGYKMSTIFGLKYTPACHHIDLIINGDFKGNYLLCDQIDVNKDRVDITKMDSTCTNEPEVTGGYLIEGDAFAEKEPSFFKTNQGILFCIKYPNSDDITPQQSTYIKNYFDKVEAEIYQNNLENIDFDSFARYFIIQDFAGNIDGVWSSFYLTKERGDNKIYFGPVWDLDLAFDNDIFLYPTNEKKNFAFRYTYSNGSTQTLVMKLLSNEALLKKIKDVWKEMTSSGFTKEAILSFINEQVELINESQKLNFIRWNILNEKQFLQPAARGSYEAEIQYLKEFIENRFSIFGEIVNSATTQSVNEEVQGGWGSNGAGMWGWPGQNGQNGWPNWGNGQNGQNGWPNWGDGQNGQNGWPNWGNGQNGQNGQNGWPNWGNGNN